MSLFSNGIGFGRYGQFNPGFDFGPSDGCDPGRANTCGTQAADGSSTCFDDRGCPVYSEGSGGIKVLAKQGTQAGKELLRDRIRHAQDTGESLTVDIFGNKKQIGGGIDPKILIGGGLALAVIVVLIATRNRK